MLEKAVISSHAKHVNGERKEAFVHGAVQPRRALLPFSLGVIARAAISSQVTVAGAQSHKRLAARRAEAISAHNRFSESEHRGCNPKGHWISAILMHGIPSSEGPLPNASLGDEAWPRLISPDASERGPERSRRVSSALYIQSEARQDIAFHLLGPESDPLWGEASPGRVLIPAGHGCATRGFQAVVFSPFQRHPRIPAGLRSLANRNR